MGDKSLTLAQAELANLWTYMKTTVEKYHDVKPAEIDVHSADENASENLDVIEDEKSTGGDDWESQEKLPVSSDDEKKKTRKEKRKERKEKREKAGRDRDISSDESTDDEGRRRKRAKKGKKKKKKTRVVSSGEDSD